MSIEAITKLLTELVAVIGAITIAANVILKGIRETKADIRNNRDITVAGQEVVAAKSIIKDNKLQDIHVLVNSRLLSALRLIVFLTKREAERTGIAADNLAYQEAAEELKRAEEANITPVTGNPEDALAVSDAEEKLAKLLKK